MKNIALLITAVILSNFIFSQEFETTTDYYKNGVKKSEGMMHLGREMGHWQYFDSNGKLVRETDYYKGELYGNDITYYPNGNKNEEFTFESNLKNGSYKNWYESGVLRTEGFYKYDVKDSSWTTYYNTGKPEMEVLYNQGSGRIISFYSPKNEKPLQMAMVPFCGITSFLPNYLKGLLPMVWSKVFGHIISKMEILKKRALSTMETVSEHGKDIMKTNN
ncbi:MAG TPA: hypothetical protein PLK75_06795 [Bacteroidales bacterium]|nr:hypothetical protein [Bacteroidales bacterium]